ncbi:MAG: hypothetical protein HYW03_00835 [Deltaproteobacteria bacterium]|nr:hypothetical protein [Deltaproteobacteria bacterium]
MQCGWLQRFARKLLQLIFEIQHRLAKNAVVGVSFEDGGNIDQEGSLLRDVAAPQVIEHPYRIAAVRDGYSRQVDEVPSQALLQDAASQLAGENGKVGIC